MLRLKGICFLLAVFLAAFSSSAAAAAKNEITGIRWSVQDNSSDGSRVVRIVADVKSPVKVLSAYDDSKKTLTVNINGALPGGNTGNLPIKTDKIKQVVGQKASSGDSRLVISLTSSLPKDGYKVFVLKKDSENKKPDRVVIDIFERMPQPAGAAAGLKGKIVLVDPGHGGSDPGAVGLNGTKEKDFTLKLSVKLRDALVKEGAKVVMTRSGDTDVHSRGATARDELQARVDIGIKAKADIFVSVHSNASVKREQGGLSTYYYAKTQRDALLAESVQNSLTQGFALENKGVRQADFYVTKRSPMPAILLEIAFISNPAEEKLLNSNWFQNKVVACIVQGIGNYFNKNSGGGAKK
ncbi:MAG: N-acetylmuramoyl-L-alanine amidase [Acidaminococcales bacterium]|jgi:N-acetylmuramoyl-L-alanine amidase|nr:N-acetylmuramoyl-L-alanine amidase [Acidaminococcales bacterium]